MNDELYGDVDDIGYYDKDSYFNIFGRLEELLKYNACRVR